MRRIRIVVGNPEEIQRCCPCVCTFGAGGGGGSTLEAPKPGKKGLRPSYGRKKRRRKKRRRSL